MKKKVMSREDPVVQEVRDARARLVKKGGGTIKGYFETARKLAESRRPAVKASSDLPRRRKSA